MLRVLVALRGLRTQKRQKGSSIGCRDVFCLIAITLSLKVYRHHRVCHKYLDIGHKKYPQLGTCSTQVLYIDSSC
jgi:hypothetical protein